MSVPRFTVYEADRAGCVYPVLRTSDPYDALKALLSGPKGIYRGVTLTDDEESGDVTEQVEEEVSDLELRMAHIDEAWVA